MIVKNYSIIENTYYGYGNPPKILFRLKSDNCHKFMYLGDCKELMSLYDKNTWKDFKLDELKKVYFDPNCTYPRYKLANFTNVKRCLKPEKADAVIITPTKYSNDYYPVYYFYSPTHDHYYTYYESTYNNSTINRDLKNNSKSNVPPIMLLEYLITNEIVSDDTVYKGISKIVYVNEDDEKSLSVLKGSHNFILDTDLDKAISDTLSTVDESDIESIDEMLGSSDLATVGLGMDLLINYNVIDRACTIGMMLVKHGKNILRTTKKNSVGFKNILSALKITQSDLLYYNDNARLHYINKLYRIATNEEDKEMAYKMAVSTVQKQLEDSFSSMSDAINNLGIKVDIKAY